MKKITLITTALLLLHNNIVRAQLYQDAGGVAITMHSKSEIKTLPDGSPLTEINPTPGLSYSIGTK
jgi:hypothetical protein